MLSDAQLLDQITFVNREILFAEDELRMLNDRLNMTAMKIRADSSGLSEPQIWLETWKDGEWWEIYTRINKVYTSLVSLRSEFNDLHRRLQYATMVKVAVVARQQEQVNA